MPQTYADTLVSLAEHCAPEESCALLVGRLKDGCATVTDIILTQNVDKRPHVRFSIAPDELIMGYKTAQRCGNDIVGIFHSHPDSEAKPSRTDMEYMAANPVAWVIHSVRDNAMRAYHLDESGNSAEMVLSIGT